MAKKKRRKSKKNKGNITLIVMLAVIFVIIGIFVIKAINKDDTGAETTTTNPDEYVHGSNIDSGDGYYDSSDEEDDDTTQEDAPSQPVSTTFHELTEQATESTTSTINNISADVVDVIIDYYTDLMGFPQGALFIKESETDESATMFTYTLRLNAKGSPNELIGDVYVEKGTGRVTDSMGNEPWNIEE